MSGQQFYSEKEVGEIVRRAAELQERAPGDGAAYSPGVSRDELARVAKEMGIDPAYLDKAIQERMGKGTGSGINFLGVPITRDYEKVVPGELPPEDFDVVMDEIGPRRRAAFTSQVGRSLQSTVMTGIGRARLSVASRDGRTRIRLKSMALFAGLMTLYPLFIVAVIIASQVHESGGPLWATPAIFGAAMAVGWTGFMALARRGHRAIEELGERLATRIAEVTHHQSATTLQDMAEEQEQTLHDKA